MHYYSQLQFILIPRFKTPMERNQNFNKTKFIAFSTHQKFRINIEENVIIKLVETLNIWAFKQKEYKFRRYC